MTDKRDFLFKDFKIRCIFPVKIPFGLLWIKCDRSVIAVLFSLAARLLMLIGIIIP